MKTNKTQDMKKVLLPLFAASMLFAACENEQDVAPVLTHQEGITFTVPDFKNGDDTRMAVDVNASGATFTWTEGDTLGVFPSNGYQTAFPISGGAGTNTAVFDGADWALRPNASYAAYYPLQHNFDLDKTGVPVSYLGQTQDGNGSTAHIGDYDFLASKFTAVDANGNVNFILNHLGCLVRFQLTMPEADTYTSMTVSCDGVEGIAIGKFDLTASTPALTAVSTSSSITLGLQNIQTTAPNQVLTLYMMLPPMDLNDKQIKIKVFGEKVYESTVTGVNMLAGKIYGCVGSFVLSNAPQYHNGHEYVDLGLPSGTMWATCNVGANSPVDFGGYFSWGEVTPKEPSAFYWSFYQWSQGSYSTITTYCVNESFGLVDGLSVLKDIHDAAFVNYGDGWRMPYYDDIIELRSKCPVEVYDGVTNQYQPGCTVAGCKLTGPNGNHIFIPTGGMYQGENFVSSMPGSFYFWTKEIWPGSSEPVAYLANLELTILAAKYCWGIPIRPVYRPNEIKMHSIVLNKSILSVQVGTTETLSVTLSPREATRQKVYWFSTDSKVASVDQNGTITPIAVGTCIIGATSADGTGLRADCRVIVQAPTLTHNGHEYVDLGLPSGLKWATCNVGATKPEEYGDYFAWGETEPYYTEGHSLDSPCSNWKSGKSNGYDWLSYKYCNGSYESLTKYCTSSGVGTVDNKTVLEAADDAAAANWGGSWRMPTVDELDDLRNNCTWNWTTKNGVKGYNVVGPNGNSIFLPAAGSHYISRLECAGLYGYYWTSSLGTEGTIGACGLYFDSGGHGWDYYYRSCGFSVRPVCQ